MELEKLPKFNLYLDLLKIPEATISRDAKGRAKITLYIDVANINVEDHETYGRSASISLQAQLLATPTAKRSHFCKMFASKEKTEEAKKITDQKERNEFYNKIAPIIGNMCPSEVQAPTETKVEDLPQEPFGNAHEDLPF